MTEREKMLAGKLYTFTGEELQNLNRRAQRLTRQFNQSTEEEQELRVTLLKQLFAHTGEHIRVEPNLHCDYGCHISVGEHFFANYDCTILDVCRVTIGDNVMFAPRVSLYTAAHPIDAQVRAAHLEFGSPITIGNDVWIGGNTVVLPGVTIGSDVVIGAGSVVTRDIPDHVVAAGNPCCVLREITEEDHVVWTNLANESKSW